MYDVIIAGGGAAGFYAAIHITEQAPAAKVAILERGTNVLSKVKISGGGRCNLTHKILFPKELTTYYPRGQKELLGPFHTHGPEDVIAFFETRGVPLKTERDGRVFPTSNTSQTVIDCLLSETKRLGIKVCNNTVVQQFQKQGSGWRITTTNQHYQAKKLLLTTGSNPKIWELLAKTGHTIVPPVPSLFTFNIDDKRIQGLQGISQYAAVTVFQHKPIPTGITVELKSLSQKQSLLQDEGPVLITHCGLSGPAILKLSAWGANILHEQNYTFKVHVNWASHYNTSSMTHFLKQVKSVEAKKTMLRTYPLDMPKRLWAKLVIAANMDQGLRWADASDKNLRNLAEQLTASSFLVTGKSTFKEEFVTAGGVHLKEINFKTFESKLHPNLYFAGEIINVDGVTGGFNFQNAWTGAYIAAKAIATSGKTPQQNHSTNLPSPSQKQPITKKKSTKKKKAKTTEN